MDSTVNIEYCIRDYQTKTVDERIDCIKQKIKGDSLTKIKELVIDRENIKTTNPDRNNDSGFDESFQKEKSNVSNQIYNEPSAPPEQDLVARLYDSAVSSEEMSNVSNQIYNEPSAPPEQDLVARLYDSAVSSEEIPKWVSHSTRISPSNEDDVTHWLQSNTTNNSEYPTEAVTSIKHSSILKTPRINDQILSDEELRIRLNDEPENLIEQKRTHTETVPIENHVSSTNSSNVLKYFSKTTLFFSAIFGLATLVLCLQETPILTCVWEV